MLYAIAAVIALIADQALKYWTTANIELDGGFKALIPGFIRLTNIHNSGAAFSFLEGARWLFVVLCIIFVLALVWLLVKRIIATPGARWAAVFVMAGALGNCVDRVLSGYVVDMLEFEFVRFPVFNLADIFITVGAVVFCICLLLEKPVAADSQAAAGAPKKAQRSDYVRTPYVPPEPAPRRPEPPPFDPEDPFAEWEVKSAETPPAAPAAPGAPAQPAAPAVPETPARPADSVPSETPARPAAPAAPEPGESFDLEDILSEFKDL